MPTPPCIYDFNTGNFIDENLVEILTKLINHWIRITVIIIASFLTIFIAIIIVSKGSRERQLFCAREGEGSRSYCAVCRQQFSSLLILCLVLSLNVHCLHCNGCVHTSFSTRVVANTCMHESCFCIIFQYYFYILTCVDFFATTYGIGTFYRILSSFTPTTSVFFIFYRFFFSYRTLTPLALKS